MKREAEISACGKYRYSLTRWWGPGTNWVAFIMLNPSTADAAMDDPTIRRCVGFAKDWGFAGLLVVNLYAFRATKPKALLAVADPVGPDNDFHLLSACSRAAWTVCAWGARGNKRWAEVRKSVALQGSSGKFLALRLNKDGSPQHPLYVPKSVQPIEFDRGAL